MGNRPKNRRHRVIVLNGFSEYVKQGRPVVTLGNFDGVHVGHAFIFREMTAYAARSGERSVAVTFRSHPRNVLYPENKVPFLTSAEEKIELIESSGIDICIVVDFTREISLMTADVFTRRVFSEILNASCVVLGYDHAFGKNREGSIDSLRELGADCGFEVLRLEPVLYDNEVVSSSRIRTLLEAGDIPGASECLGRNYSLRGIVVRGFARGRELGFPTANLSVFDGQKCIPAEGVYSSLFTCGDGSVYSGITSVGTNPTFGGSARTVETHLFDFSGDLYDQSVEIEFTDRIRGEMKFSGPDELKTQIALDCEKARLALRER